MRTWMILMVLCATAHADVLQELAVPAAPAISTGPGLDPDVVARLAEVERAAEAVAPAALDQVVERALVTFESEDPFSVAQRAAARPRTVAVLTKIGAGARAA